MKFRITDKDNKVIGFITVECPDIFKTDMKMGAVNKDGFTTLKQR